MNSTPGGTDTEKRYARIGNRRMRIPRSRIARMTLGFALVVGGFLGFLPILGFWMIPLGLIVLSYDVPLARRLVKAGRRGMVRLWRAWRGRPERASQ